MSSVIIENINKIININGLKKYCNDNGIVELIIYGSRIKQQETKTSDIDIMIVSYETKQNKTEQNEKSFVKKQRNMINKYYQNILPYVIDTSVKLDFKLNIDESDGYAGITYGTHDDKKNMCDFIFDWCDITEYISITKNKIEFINNITKN